MLSFGIFLRMWQKKEVDICKWEQWRGGVKKGRDTGTLKQGMQLWYMKTENKGSLIHVEM